MHIPDGPLSPVVCGVTGAVSAGVVGYSLYRLRDSLADRTVPMAGMMAALVFAGQMVNFPASLFGIPTFSGHLMGGVLAACLLGPWGGCLALTLVLTVQLFLFADGGMLALGANVLNMAVIGSVGGYAVMSAVRNRLGNGPRGTLVGAVLAAWLSVMAAAALFCAEFYFSWQSTEFDFRNIFTLMISFHSVIGIGEAVITGGVISFILIQRPDLIYRPEESTGPGRQFAGVGRTVTAGLLCALAVAGFLAPFASPLEDGLEAVGSQTFSPQTEQAATVLALSDYEIPSPVAGWNDSPVWRRVTVSLAGFLGIAVVLVTAFLFDRSFRRRTTGIEQTDG
jgi:cobalt/nickel transport system permease protein